MIGLHGETILFAKKFCQRQAEVLTALLGAVLQKVWIIPVKVDIGAQRASCQATIGKETGRPDQGQSYLARSGIERRLVMSSLHKYSKDDDEHSVPINAASFMEKKSSSTNPIRRGRHYFARHSKSLRCRASRSTYFCPIADRYNIS